MKAGGQEARTYRGRTLEEVLPQIKAELGPDAVITRQRSGLTGGVGGFFQRACVEVEARPPEQRFDAYDDEPAMPDASAGREAGPRATHVTPPDEADAWVPGIDAPALDTPDAATREGLGARAIQEMLDQAAPFADQLAEAQGTAAPPPREPADPPPSRRFDPVDALAPTAPPGRRFERAGARVRPAVADQFEAALVAAGMDAALAASVVADTASHLLPFGSTRALKRLVREELARRIAIAPTPTGTSRRLAFVGPPGSGKTLCSIRLAGAYATGSDLRAVCVALGQTDRAGELRQRLDAAGVPVLPAAGAEQARAHVQAEADDALVVVDTGAFNPTAETAVSELRAELERVGLDEVHLTLPATFSGPAARRTIAAGVAVGATGAVVTHAGEAADAGAVIGALIDAALPISYVSDDERIAPADPVALAAMVLR